MILDKKRKAIKLAWDLLAPLSSTLRQPPIYLAGMPRSGTTWIAFILSTGVGIKYFHEPFNPDAFPRAEKHSNKYLRPNDEDRELAAYCQEVFRGDSYRQSRSTGSSWIHEKVSWWPGRLMIKDVHSLMTLEWIDRQFSPLIAIVIRHPCGLGACYYVALEQSRKNDRNWIVVEHEALCRDPVAEYRRLFERLNLNWNQATDYMLHASTTRDTGKRYVPGRVSSREADKWKKILEPQQVKLIRDFSEPFGILHYQEDW